MELLQGRGYERGFTCISIIILCTEDWPKAFNRNKWRSVAKFIVTDLGIYVVDSGIGLSYRPPGYYNPSQGLWIFLLFAVAETGNWLLPPTNLLNQQRKRLVRPLRENKDEKRGTRKRGSHYRCVNWRGGGGLQIDISEAYVVFFNIYIIYIMYWGTGVKR